MQKTIEMPIVQACPASRCAYNQGGDCHAKAITIGNGVHPACDTFFMGAQTHADGGIEAGVGACKVEACQHNTALECQAQQIRMNVDHGQAECATYAP